MIPPLQGVWSPVKSSGSPTVASQEPWPLRRPSGRRLVGGVGSFMLCGGCLRSYLPATHALVHMLTRNSKSHWNWFFCRGFSVLNHTNTHVTRATSSWCGFGHLGFFFFWWCAMCTWFSPGGREENVVDLSKRNWLGRELIHAFELIIVLIIYSSPHHLFSILLAVSLKQSTETLKAWQEAGFGEAQL